MNGNLIGRRITEARLDCGLTKKELADKTGLASSTIGRYESGEILKHKLPVLDSIAHALDVNPDWICGKSEIKKNDNSLTSLTPMEISQRARFASYIKLISELNPEGRELLIQRAEELSKLGYADNNKNNNNVE